MTAAMVLLGMQAAALVLGLALLASRPGARRRRSFDATIARHHPELVRTVRPHTGDLGRVAATAVDLYTPGAPRQLGSWEPR